MMEPFHSERKISSGFVSPKLTCCARGKQMENIRLELHIVDSRSHHVAGGRLFVGFQLFQQFEISRYNNWRGRHSFLLT